MKNDSKEEIKIKENSNFFEINPSIEKQENI